MQFDLEMRRKPLNLHQNFLDLGGEYIDPAQDDHIVTAPGYLFHPPHGPRRAGHQAGQVAGAIADDWKRLFAERGKHQLSQFAIG